ncbi:carboxymuconolactone decarboxylase family protein [Paenibacillus sp. 598K]|uniref:carboxymuconolactone decarboxylase family protein n=1 Tax=Paenibacillus sp. 598K TaxID=1117987 RepID=UPI000FFAADDD|nr:carboxymuconolactone decarboxylase family protein [Paenibacillus sp. 598K]GBF76064.1 carboxymuconolactone decarboxylase family protein [Paenibacillus sp. 598K]
METRFIMGKVFPKGYAAVGNLYKVATESSIEMTLQELMYIRASQINKCAFCIDGHTKKARAYGETEQRIYALSAWEDSNLFTEKEKAALALTESITLINKEQLPDSVYREVEKHFSQEEIAELIMAAIMINTFNRVAIATRLIP